VSNRLPVILGLTILHAALSSVLGLHLALWLECSIAGAMVVIGTLFFVLAWIFSPTQGLLRRWLWRRIEAPQEMPPDAVRSGGAQTS
jgi:manganese/zinc/iron transport system permease protein